MLEKQIILLIEPANKTIEKKMELDLQTHTHTHMYMYTESYNKKKKGNEFLSVWRNGQKPKCLQ